VRSFLDNLVARSIGLEPGLRPRVPSLFTPETSGVQRPDLDAPADNQTDDAGSRQPRLVTNSNATPERASPRPSWSDAPRDRTSPPDRAPGEGRSSTDVPDFPRPRTKPPAEFPPVEAPPRSIAPREPNEPHETGAAPARPPDAPRHAFPLTSNPPAAADRGASLITTGMARGMTDVPRDREDFRGQPPDQALNSAAREPRAAPPAETPQAAAPVRVTATIRPTPSHLAAQVGVSQPMARPQGQPRPQPPPEPVIHVTIGRLEIRAVPAGKSERAGRTREPATAGGQSLQAYLARRARAGGGPAA
jgi:hypothetical protein